MSVAVPFFTEKLFIPNSDMCINVNLLEDSLTV